MPKRIISQKRLKELLHYDPEAGIFTRLISLGGVQIGDVAGTLKPNGYIFIMVDRRIYRAHRLAFLYMTGDWPIDQVDHDNRIRSDNRWKNLNQATNSINQKNKSIHSNNTSGVMGVSWDKCVSKWVAEIQVNGKGNKLGRFTEIEDAIKVRKSAEIKYGYHENHGYKETT